MTDPVRTARGRLAAAIRFNRDPEVIDAIRREMNAAKLERAIHEALAAECAITDDDRARLAALIAPAGGER